MTAHSFTSLQRMPPSKAEVLKQLGPIAARHGRITKGQVLPETRIQVCPRVKMSDLPEGFIPPKYYAKNLEYNQQVKLCCRHVENHEIAAFKSHPDEEAPDQYEIYCGECGATHRYWLLGMTDDLPRPMWKAD